MDVHVLIYCDNISSILLANNPVYHVKTKHIEVHYHFIREKILAKEIDLIPRGLHPNGSFSRDSQVGVPKLSRNCPG